jgi:hypothetical protein
MYPESSCDPSLSDPVQSNTGSSDNIAVSFYRSLSFEELGAATDWAPGRTMDDSDIVLRRILS